MSSDKNSTSHQYLKFFCPADFRRKDAAIFTDFVLKKTRSFQLLYPFSGAYAEALRIAFAYTVASAKAHGGARSAQAFRSSAEKIRVPISYRDCGENTPEKNYFSIYGKLLPRTQVIVNLTYAKTFLSISASLIPGYIPGIIPDNKIKQKKN